MSASREIKERIAKLQKLLAHHARQYYTLDAPELSDSAYDALYRELRELEEKYPELANTNSITPANRGRSIAVPEESAARSAAMVPLLMRFPKEKCAL